VKQDATAAYNDPGVLALELAHSLAFRHGLGAGLFASISNEVTVSDIQAYASKVYSKGNIAVVGTGIDEELLKKLIDEHFSGSSATGSATGESSKYHGGETRVGPSPESHHHGPQTVFIGYGASSPSSDLAILAAYLDPTTSLKWAQSTSPLSEVQAAGTTIKGVYLPYSDATLAGVLIQSASAEEVKKAGAAVAKAVQAVKSGNLSGEAFAAALAKAKFRAASALETRDGLSAAVGSKVLAGGDASVESITAALDGVNQAAFSKSVATTLGSKPTYVAVGDVSALPFADELGL